MNNKIAIFFLCVVCLLFTDCTRRKLLKEDNSVGKVKIKRKAKNKKGRKR